MHTIIKWPGGKSGEIDKIKELIPEFDRYIEPFFGGGAVFFNLTPKCSIINDVSPMLMKFYELVKTQDNDMYKLLIAYNESFQSLLDSADNLYSQILSAFTKNMDSNNIESLVKSVINNAKLPNSLILNANNFFETLCKMVKDKFQRTFKNNSKTALSESDLKDNLLTGFASGYYIHFRNIYNKIALREIDVSVPYMIANFYFIREYCYGSMFRYNSHKEFNIPYGGISYNKKNFLAKINAMFNKDIENLFSKCTLYNMDFEDLLSNINLTAKDFIFLDPPYDTEFSDYEGRAFTKDDQTRLSQVLKKIPAQFILIIKNTDFIFNLYKDNFRIITFDKNYTYNVRSRNVRNTEHLIITNIPK